MREILKKIRKYEIQIRKIITHQRQGDFHSLFKGSGLEFDDIRPYQYGDDVRVMDWNASAKGHGAYVKTFKEDKEQIIFFIVDVSASQDIGSKGRTKLDISKEVCGILTLSAIKESSQVGLVSYSDQREDYIKPKKGIRQAYEIINCLMRQRARSKNTDLKQASYFVLNHIKKKSLIIVISDFIDHNYFFQMRAMAHKHDLILIRISDRRETNIPGLGIIPVKDKESKKTFWINSSWKKFRSNITNQHVIREEQLVDFCKKNQVDFLHINTHEDYVPKLLKLFRYRNKFVKSA